MADVVPISVGDLQVNGCRTPACPNYGAPPAIGQHAHRPDPRYRLHGAVGHTVILCPGCGRQSSLLANRGIALEIDRLETRNGELLDPGCPDPQCVNHRRPANRFPAHYVGHGKTPAGRPRLRCRACKRTFALGVEQKARSRVDLNQPMVRALVNRMPIRGLIRTFDTSAELVFDQLDFARRQMLRFEAAKLSKLVDLKRHERLFLALGTDAQDQLVNWWSRDRREPVQLSCIATADDLSGFVFRSDFNYDPSTGDAGEHFEALWRGGEFEVPEGLGLGDRDELQSFLRAALWCLQKSRSTAASPRDAELDDAIAAALALLSQPSKLVDPGGCPPNGAVVRRIYTAIAHFAALDRLLPPRARLHLMTDIDHTLLAGALVSMGRRVRADAVDVNVVDCQKGMSQPKKEVLVRAYKKDLEAFAQQFDPGLVDATQVRQAYIAAHAAPVNHQINGLAAQIWAVPVQTIYEPNKRVGIVVQRPPSRTGNAADDRVRLLDRSSLHAVDTFFNFLRSRLAYLDRPGLSRSTGQHYNRFQPYRASALQQAVDIARVWYNWCKPRPFRIAKDFDNLDAATAGSAHQRLQATQRQTRRAPFREEKSTPAMRLGLASRPTRRDTILSGTWA